MRTNFRPILTVKLKETLRRPRRTLPEMFETPEGGRTLLSVSTTLVEDTIELHFSLARRNNWNF